MNEGYLQKEMNEITSKSKEDQLQHLNQALSSHQRIFPLIGFTFCTTCQTWAIASYHLSSLKLENWVGETHPVSVDELNSNWKYQGSPWRSEEWTQFKQCTMHDLFATTKYLCFFLFKSHSLSTNWSSTFKKGSLSESWFKDFALLNPSTGLL